MRIAYLNVWGADASETHTGAALRKVAQSLGAELIPCRNSAEAEACRPDFALVLSRTQAKLTRCPTYLAINEPASVYLREPNLMTALYSFDGYFALADSLRRFLEHALYGIGRKEEIGVYYNTAPRFPKDSTAVRDALFGGNARLTYFGVNWDGRRSNFFRQLGTWPDVELYGPRRAWEQAGLPAYKGEVAYDGLAVIEKYQHNGIGLNIQGEHHVQEDVISNRVFEIAAAGAVGLSCRMPWLEKNFGDSLYYFEQETSDKCLLEQIRALLGHIRAHPEEAWQKAQATRRIFEEKFALEVLLKNTIDYHARRQAHLAQYPRKKDPLISLVICSDGKNIPGLKRALASVAAQERGRFQVILVKTDSYSYQGPKAPYVNVESLQAAPEQTPLWQGLARAKGDYIALLNEAHEWFPQHIHRLLQSIDEGRETFVHSALVEEGAAPAADTAWVGNNELRGLTHQLDVQGKDYKTAMELITPCGFLASRALFDERLMQDPRLAQNEKEYLIMSLMARARARQNFAATVLLHKNEQVHSTPASATWTEIMLRLWRENPHTGVPNTLFEQLPDYGYRLRARRYETVRTEKNGMIYDALKFSRFDPARLRPIPVPWLREQSFFHLGVSLLDEQQLSLSINTNESMRGVAGFIAFPQEENAPPPIEYLLVLEAEVEKGQFGVQLLHNHRTLERYSVARAFSAGKRTRLELPVYYRPEISGLVIEVSPHTVGKIHRLEAFAEV